jgi:hypothetical protein
MKQVEFFTNKKEILNAYIFGSRAYGTDTEESDWDFIFVTKDDFEYELDSFSERQVFKINDNKKGERIMITTEEYNISLYKKSVFMKLVEENMIWVHFCIHLPKQFILKEEFNFKEFPARFSQIQKSVLTESARCWRKSRNLFREKNFKKGKKLLVYTFMYIDWGIQLYQKNTIDDNSCAKIKKKQILFDESNEWQHFEDLYLKEYQELEDKFTSMMSHKYLNLSEKKSEENAYHDLKFVLQKFKLESLVKEFSISAINHRKFKNLLRLERNVKESPDHYDFVNLCDQVVVDINDFRVVVPPIYNHILDDFETHYSINRTYSFEIRLFFYKKEWICSPIDEHLEEEFWRLWNSFGYELPAEKYQNFVFSFDLMSFKYPNTFKPQKEDLILIQAHHHVFSKWNNFHFEEKMFNWRGPSVFIGDNIEIFESGVLNINKKNGSKFFPTRCYSSIMALSSYLKEYESLIIEEEPKISEIIWSLIVLFPLENHEEIFKQERIKKLYFEKLKYYERVIKIIQETYDSISTLERNEYFKKVSKYKFKAILFHMKNENCEDAQEILKISSYPFTKIISSFPK